jgi:probable DNA metabolism protein
MTTLVFDGSFEGLLTCIFEVYEYRYDPVSILEEKLFQESLLGESRCVITDEAKAERVWMGLKKKLSNTAIRQFQHSFLSEQKSIPNTLLAYAQYVFSSKGFVDSDMSHPAVLEVVNWAKKVYREKHRMEAFVRFQLTADNIYYAVIEPDFNVLPIIRKHFRDRYADQQWIIHDIRRKYALFYDLKEVHLVTVNFPENIQSGENHVFHEEEPLYQQLWQRYFKSVNIGARKNTKLHVQHMPKRYWKYLTEKK